MSRERLRYLEAMVGVPPLFFGLFSSGLCETPQLIELVAYLHPWAIIFLFSPWEECNCCCVFHVGNLL